MTGLISSFTQFIEANDGILQTLHGISVSSYEISDLLKLEEVGRVA